VVGVQFGHQRAVRLPDRVWVGAGRETEDGVGLLDTHITARRPNVPAARACGALAGERVAPVRTDAVEIGFEEARPLLILGAALAQQR
jgi:hypothetical protein